MMEHISKVTLASGSPRRIEMLGNLGLELRIIIPDVEEDVRPSLSPRQLVMYLALKKALFVERKLAETGETLKDSVLIAGDTIVYADGVIGKPETEEDAFRILSLLRARAHTVYSGVCLLGTQKDIRRLFFSETQVFFKDYTDEDIRKYIESGEPMDKAGAYAIQGGFAPYIDHIEGNMDNVIGLPLTAIKQELQTLGLTLG